MKQNNLCIVLSFLLLPLMLKAQLPSVVQDANKNIRKTELTRTYLTPTRIVWQSDKTGNYVKNPELLLNPGIGQADRRYCAGLWLRNTGRFGNCYYRSQSKSRGTGACALWRIGVGSNE